MKKIKAESNFLENTGFQRGDRIVYNDEFGTVVWGVKGMPDRIMVIMDVLEGLPKNHPNRRGNMRMLEIKSVKKVEE